MSASHGARERERPLMTSLRVIGSESPAVSAGAEIDRVDGELAARFAPRIAAATILTRWYWRRRWQQERARALERLAPRLAWLIRG